MSEKTTGEAVKPEAPKRDLPVAIPRITFRHDCPIKFVDPWMAGGSYSGDETYFAVDDVKRPGLRIQREGQLIRIYCGSVCFAEAPVSACQPWPVVYDQALASAEVKIIKAEIDRKANAERKAAEERYKAEVAEREKAQREVSNRAAENVAKMNATPKSPTPTVA